MIAVARRLDRLDELAASSSRIVRKLCDVTKQDDIERLGRDNIDRFGKLDILVNNAGRGSTSHGSAGEPIDEFRFVVELNLVALYNVTSEFSRSMLDGRSGVIINVVSILGLVASAPIKQASYTATKAAVINLTSSSPCRGHGKAYA